MTRAVAGLVGAVALGCAPSSSKQTEPSPVASKPSEAVVVARAPAPATSSAQPPATNVCADGMVLVDGTYCTELSQACVKQRKPWQCAEFEPTSTCRGTEKPMRFCIDRYEYPNKKGEHPELLVSWVEAKNKCEAAGKRLCTESEWTLACEGPERRPFPYGHVRDSEACNIDKPSPKVDESRLYASATQDEEVARLDQREPSGSRARCVSGYGVHDLTGNVDEWVLNETGQPYKSALKGGNWGEYRNACRPSTRGHAEGWYYYQTGFRCCAAPPD